jgi:hypothetical protein
MSEHETKTTTDHDEIRRWAEERGGRPAAVEGTGGDGDPGVLRIEFRDDADRLEETDWDEWFKAFDENNLAFVYQEKTKDGGQSRFFKLVDRDSVK